MHAMYSHATFDGLHVQKTSGQTCNLLFSKVILCQLVHISPLVPGLVPPRKLLGSRSISFSHGGQLRERPEGCLAMPS